MTDTLIDGAEPQGPPAVPSRNLLSVLWQRKALILFGLAVGTLVGVLVFLQRPAVYQSSAQVHVIKKRSEVLAGPDGMAVAYEDFIPTHLVLIRSPLIVKKAVGILKEINEEREEDDLPPLSVLAGKDDAGVMGAVRGGLSAAREGNEPAAASTGIINLSYRGPVAEECPIILEAVIEAYEEYLREVSKNTLEETYKEVAKAREELEKELQDLEKTQGEKRTDGPLIWGEKDSGSFYLGRLIALDAKRAAIPLQKMEIENRLNAIAAARKEGQVPERLLSPLGLGKDKPTITERSLEEQLLPLLQQEQTLQEDFGPDHPKLKAVRRQIAMTRYLYQRRASLPAGGGPDPDEIATPERVDAFVRFLKEELKGLKETERSLNDLFEEEEEGARDVLVQLNKDQALSNKIRRKQQNFELAAQRLSEIKVASQNDSSGYRSSVISPPEGAGKVAPSLSQVVSIWVFFGLLGGVGLAYLAEVTDKSFRTPEEIRRRLGLPIIGHIPFTVAKANGDGAAAAGRLDASLFAYHRPSALEAEAYKSLRTALYFSTRGERHKVIQITSPNMGDGKSTLAANLAVCIAQSGKSVVLVDADCRRPRLHRLFGLRAELGLTSVIIGECGPQEAVLPTEVPHLSVLPCGPRPTNPAELLTSPKFEELLNELRGRYDFVLVDSPPLLAVTDPCVVAARADGVLLTIRVSKNGRPAAERAKEILNGIGAKVLGVVVNGIGKEAGAYGYGYRHYRYDHYGYQYKSSDEEADPVVSAEKNGAAAEAGERGA